MAAKKHHIVLKVTDNETGAEILSSDIVVEPGWGFCSCSSSSYTSPQVSPVLQATAKS